MSLGEIRLISPPHICVFKHLTMPTQMARPLDISPQQIHFLRGMISLQQIEHKSPKRIYVSRSDASIRRIVNEDALMTALVPLGFVKVKLAALTFAEQVQLFQRANIVIGHHGAGHTNVVFCSPEATLIEIFQQGHFSPRFARMAQLRGMRYGYLVGTPEGRDTVVDVPILMSLLSKLKVT